jgi:hypothetical protein
MTECIGDFNQFALELDVGVIIESEDLNGDAYAPETVERIVTFLRRSYLNRPDIAEHCRSAVHEFLHWDVPAKTLAQSYREMLIEGRWERGLPTRGAHHKSEYQLYQ